MAEVGISPGRGGAVKAESCSMNPNHDPNRQILTIHIIFIFWNSSPFLFPDCLDLPIKDLSVEQKRFISHLLNGKDPLGKQSTEMEIHVREQKFYASLPNDHQEGTPQEKAK